MRTAVPVMLAAAAVGGAALVVGCAGGGIGDDGSTKKVGGDVFTGDAKPAPKTGGPAAKGTAKSKSAGGAPTDPNPYTLRLQTFAGAGHQKRAEYLVSELTSKGLHDGFVVDQVEESVVCYGRYPAAVETTRLKEGKERPTKIYPDKMVKDNERLLAAFVHPGTGKPSLRPAFLLAPKTGSVNRYSIEKATGEWTIHFMSVYGEPDSRNKALDIAQVFQEMFSVPVFVVKDGEQYLLCAGDLPKDAVKLDVLNKAGPKEKALEYKITERGWFALRDQKMPAEALDRLDKSLVNRGYATEDEFRRALRQVIEEDDLKRWETLILIIAKPRRFAARGFEAEFQGEPASDEAKRLWAEEELRYFRENGHYQNIPKVFSGVDSAGKTRPPRVLSRWMRITDMKGHGVGYDESLTPAQRALLGQP